jgi:hypothetical protein
MSSANLDVVYIPLPRMHIRNHDECMQMMMKFAIALCSALLFAPESITGMFRALAIHRGLDLHCKRKPAYSLNL